MREARRASAEAALREESAMFTRSMRGDFLAGPLSAADFALYPMVAFLDRCAHQAAGLRSASRADARARGVEGAHRGAAVLRRHHPAALAEEVLRVRV